MAGWALEAQGLGPLGSWAWGHGWKESGLLMLKSPPPLTSSASVSKSAFSGPQFALL